MPRAERETEREEPEACDVRIIHFDRVRHAKKHSVGRHELDRMSHLFKALGDPTRLRLLMAIRDQEMCVCDLAAALGMTESAVSHQLRRLREQALVRTRREAQVVYYALDDDHVTHLLEVGLAHASE